MLDPPSSDIEAGASTSVTVGAASLSASVTEAVPTVRPVTAVDPLTVSVSSGSSISSFSGASVKVPVWLVAPEAIVIVKSLTATKSVTAVAVFPATETVTGTVVARAAPFSIAVTVKLTVRIPRLKYRPGTARASLPAGCPAPPRGTRTGRRARRAASHEPGATMVAVAARHGISTWSLSRWQRRAREEFLPTVSAGAAPPLTPATWHFAMPCKERPPHRLRVIYTEGRLLRVIGPNFLVRFGGQFCCSANDGLDDRFEEATLLTGQLLVSPSAFLALAPPLVELRCERVRKTFLEMP